MPKVLYLFDALKRGGAETSTLEITKRFEKWKPAVLSLYPGIEMKKEFEAIGVPVHSLNMKNQFAIKSTVGKIEKYIKQQQPDLIHSNLFMADQYARYLGKKHKIPVVNSFINDSYSKERYDLLSFKQRIALNFYKAIDRFSANKVTQYMSLTQAIIPNNSKALKIDPDKVVVIPRGRDIEGFRKNVNFDVVEELKQEFGPGPIILTVSRLLIRKGYLEALKALSIVKKIYPDLKYLIAGKGHDEMAIRNLVRQLKLENNVFLLGSRTDVPSLLAAADLFLFPSHYEGQGGALVEAMLMGKKIIATRIPVLEESVKDQHSAMLFNYRNHRDMADKIIWAFENPGEMEIIAANAKREAEKRFSIEKITKLHEKLYDGVLAEYKKNK